MLLNVIASRNYIKHVQLRELDSNEIFVRRKFQAISCDAHQSRLEISV